MVTKMTTKNQLTIPKKVLEQAGLSDLKDDERYFDIEVKNCTILLKPVKLIIEERMPEKQWRKFENQATKIEKGDKIFDSTDAATEFLRNKIKKK